MKNSTFKFIFLLVFVFLSTIIEAQQYTADFATAPAFTAYPGVPEWIQTATVTLGGTSYTFVNAGNGGWAYSTNGGFNNSANLLYSTAATTNVRIQRADGKRFQFYGAWLKYTNYTATLYTAPWLSVTYEGSSLPSETYNANTTTILNNSVNVTAVTLNFSGLHDLNFDNIVVGPAIPIAAIPDTYDVSTFSDVSATLSGEVVDDGGAAVTESGLVYGTNAGPTVADTKLALSNGISTFSQNVTGLQSGITYYVRSYAINSAGTSYGNEVSFTTFGTFTMAGAHNFNTDWVSTYSEPSPFTKYVEGWDATGRSSGSSPVSISRLTGESAAEGAASLSVAIDSYTESLLYMGMKPHNGNRFNLQSFVFRYDVQSPGSSFGTVNVTGYRNGVAVPAATQAIRNIAPYSSEDVTYHTFTADNNNFNNIDEFRLTVSDPTEGAMVWDFNIDEITTTTNGILPVTFTSVKAYNKNNGIQVDWNVAAENGVDHYEVEKSQNGKQFVKAADISAKANGLSSASYTWFDPNISTGNNFYRVKSVYITGNTNNSQILNVIFGVNKGTISVYPNPLLSSTINLTLNNQPKGLYTIQVFSNFGQLLFNKVINHSGGSATQSFEISKNLPKGIYEINVSSSLNRFSQKIIKN